MVTQNLVNIDWGNGLLALIHYLNNRKTSNISRTLVGNKICW